MVIEKIGINFESLRNLPAPQFNLTNITASEFMNEIPATANNITEGLYGITVLIILSVFLFVMLSERNQYSTFNFSIIRAFGLSLGICNIFGAILLQIGYMTTFVYFAYMNSLFLLILSWIILKNPE